MKTKTDKATPTAKMVKQLKQTTASIIESGRAWQAILTKGGKFFHVTFKRKTKGKNGEPIGSLRTMLARIEVHKYKNRNTGLGVYCISDEDRWEEDERCNVLTCWDVEVFNDLRKQGLGRIQAGRRAYRRINMSGVVELTAA